MFIIDISCVQKQTNFYNTPRHQLLLSFRLLHLFPSILRVFFSAIFIYLEDIVTLLQKKKKRYCDRLITKTNIKLKDKYLLDRLN